MHLHSSIPRTKKIPVIQVIQVGHHVHLPVSQTRKIPVIQVIQVEHLHSPFAKTEHKNLPSSLPKIVN